MTSGHRPGIKQTVIIISGAAHIKVGHPVFDDED